jgi:hypothetical protein
VTQAELLAGRHDATFLKSPGRAEVSHIAVQDGTGWFARCQGGRHMRGKRCRPLVEETLRLAVQVHPNGRCMQPGCRVKWPADYQPSR